MAKGLNQVQVGLTFTADTGQAKAQLQDLKNTINSLYSSTAQKSPVEGLTPKVNEALTSVAKLKAALESATNVDTGRLDLSKFSQQLKQNGVSLKQYANQLTQLGPDGEKAFLQLAQSIVTAEVPMRKANAALTEMWTTLKNTARWQISSSILHGFMGAVQSAYGYAQDLNESLNNIRIVTGYNTDQMSKFADQANKSAKALSATTTEYTNASLIYYQQGLSDSEVKERTDITIKMANAAGQSAEIVSDQMTAVWNNFDDGSKSLEYYADVMTALGAATASSTDEIAQGLEKFSAVAGTVGLSYEYATAALATVTAETRQSADVVGTAFKTLFARIEGLQLGETLEDGTDLNKYSQALATVGVQIKDAAGEMRSMDDILNDLGARWQTLAKDEQIALAQTVAGVRQYNQLISLMDNWDVMQENLGTAYSSSGTLQEQADIYAESWEAARDRVQASLETIYSNLIDDQFFIKMTDGLAGLIDKLGMFTESLGGLPGVLSLVAAVMTKVFGNQIQANISQMIDNFQIFNGAAKNAADQTRQAAIEAVQYFSRGVEVDSASGMESQVMVDQINRTYELQQISENLTQERADYLRQMIQIEEQYGKEAVAAQKAAEAATTNYTKSRSDTKLDIIDTNIEAGGDAAGGEELAQAVFAQSDAFKTLQSLGDSDKKTSSYAKEIEELHQLGVLYPELQKKYENYTKALKSGDPAQIKKATSELRKEVKHFASDTDYAERSMEKQAIRFKQARKDIPITTKNILKLSKQAREQGKSVGEASKAWEAYQKRLSALDAEFKKGQQAVASLSKGLTTSIQGISSFAMGLNSLKSAWDTFQNPDMSGMEKFISLTMSLSMGIPSLVKGLKDITGGLSLMRQGFGGSLASMAAFMLGVNAETLAEKENNEEKQKSIIWSQAKDSASKREMLSSIAKAGANKLEAEAEEEGNEEKQKKIALTLTDIVVEKLATVAKGTGTAATIAQTIANIALQTSMSPLLVITLLLTAAILALAVIIIGVVAGITALSNAYNKDAIAAKEAADYADKMAEKYNKLTEEANKFKEAVGGYDDAVAALKELDKETDEYQNALEEANKKAMELVKTYGLWDQFSYNKEGLIVFDESASGVEGKTVLDDKQAEFDDEAVKAEGDLLAAQIMANAAKRESEETNTSRKIGNVVEYQAYDPNSGTYYTSHRQFTEAETEQVVKAFQALGDVSNIDDPDALKGALSNVDNFSGELANNLDAIVANREAFEGLTNTVNDLELENAGLEKELIGNLIEEEHGSELDNMATDEEGNVNEEIRNQLANAAKEKFSEEEAAKEEGMADRIANIDVSDVTSTGDLQAIKNSKGEAIYGHVENDEDLAREYAKTVLGMSDSEVDQLDYKSGSGKGTLKDANGNAVVDEVNDEYMRQMLARQAEIDKIKEEYKNNEGESAKNEEKYYDALDNLADTAMGEQGDYGNVAGAILSSLQNGTESIDLSSTFSNLSKDEVDKLSAMSDSSNKDAYDPSALIKEMGLSEEDLITLGYDSADAFAKAMNEGLAEWTPEKAMDATAEELGISTEALDLYVEKLKETGDMADFSEDELREMAKAQITLERNVKKAAKVYEDNKDALDENLEGTEEYATACSNMADGLNEIFGEGAFDATKVSDNLDLVKKAMEGDTEALLKLQDIAAEDYLVEVGVNIEEGVGQEINDWIGSQEFNDLKIGATLDDTGMTAAFQNLLDTGAMTVDEMNTLFSEKLGFEPEITYIEAPLDDAKYDKAKNSYTIDYIDPSTGEPVTKTLTTDQYNEAKTAGIIKFPVINGKKTVKVNAPSIASKGLGNSGGGGGGGGSKSKPAEKVKRTKKSDVVERYKEINDALDDMADALDKASGKADRLYGAARVKAMRDQAKLMRDEIDLLKKKRTEAEKYKDQDKAALEAAAKAAGFKYNSKTKTYLNYDEKGNITDYTVEMEKLYKQLNDAETKMDKMSTKEAQDEYKESTVQPIQDKIDELTELISAYEESRELIEDLDKDIREKEWAEEDLNFEAFQYEIELKLEIDDRDLQYLEYLLGEIEDKAFAAAERIGNLTEQADLLMSKAETSQGAIDEILGDNLSKADKKLFDQGKLDQIDWQSYIDNETFTEAEVEELLKQADELLAYNEELFELSDQVHEELRNSFAEWNEEVEKGIALFDHYDSVVDHLQNITDLTQGLTGYNAELNRNLAETKTQLASDRAASYAQVYSDQKDVADTMRNKMYNEDGTETEWFSSLSENEQEQWIKDLEVAEESVREAEENLFASTSEAIQAAIDEFEVAFTSSLKEMERSLAGAGGFAAWNESLERQQEMSERTLKVYQETYELSKLNRQVINSINDTDNVKAKQALLEIQEEIYQYQKDGKEMSQYELDHLQKKYELRLAEIALEEAQNAKSQVRMSRDAEGNWGYVYTADEDKVAEAEQNYEDKLYEITNLTEEYQAQVSASIIQTYQEFNDAMQEIYDRNAEGLYASEEEFLNAIAETQAYYQGKLDFQYDQLDIATANNKELYENDWTNYEFSTGAKIKSNESFQTSFDKTTLGIVTGYKNSGEALTTFSTLVGTVDPKTGKGSGMLASIATSYDNMQKSVDANLGLISKALGLKEGASLDLKNFSENASKYLTNEKTGVTAKSKKTAEQIKTDSKNIKKYLIGEDGKGGLLKSVSQFSDKWTKYIQNIIDKNKDLVKSINALNKALAVEDEEKKKKKKTEEKKNTKTENKDDKKSKDEKLAERAANIVTGVHNGTIKSGSNGWKSNAKAAGYTDAEIDLALKVINDSESGSGYSYNYKKALQLLGYDTGGYTGEWGPEGKLAFLHQKELVLNQDDTNNFLLAMNVLREITKAITLQSIIPDASKFDFGGKNVVEQDVTIHAEFPNVTDHNEIEMALSNLVNTASQYANRK